MKEEDFKRLRVEVLRKAGLVNMALKKKISYAEALKIYDITDDKFTLMGWKYNKDMNIVERIAYVSFDDLKDNDTDSQEQKSVLITNENVSMFSEDDMSHLKDFINNYQIIMKMVQMFGEKKRIGSDDKNIVIELPHEEDKSFKASYRVNKTINEQFKEFCKQHTEFTAKDLLSMALKEYMDKYK